MTNDRLCGSCGQLLPATANFCPYCGNRLAGPAAPGAAGAAPSAAAAAVPAAAPIAPAVPAAAREQKDVFYVFAVQGPAFGVTDADLVPEKALALKNSYAPAQDMELKLVRPSMWDARVHSSSAAGMISVSYALEDFASEIRRYLKKENIADPLVEKGLALADENSLQLTNPMSGIFVMGIPIICEKSAEAAALPSETASDPALQAADAPADAVCAHEYRHNVCVKCGEKAPKPILSSLGIRTRGQYTYEYYRAGSAEEAQYFLAQTEVGKPLYYVMVETPQGTWGRDKDGLFLEQLCDFQRSRSLAQCEGHPSLLPLRMADLQMAANRITDNYLLEITCGACGHLWTDGVAYRSQTVVRCPECGKYNLINTENIRYNGL